MRIEVKDNLSIGELCVHFSAQFPFLKLEFFLPQAGNMPRASLLMTDKNNRLGDIRRSHAEGALVITGALTAQELEKTLLDRFGLNAQVFRRSGNAWILTTATDNFTLDRLNELGKEMTEPVPPPEPLDIHEPD